MFYTHHAMNSPRGAPQLRLCPWVLRRQSGAPQNPVPSLASSFPRPPPVTPSGSHLGSRRVSRAEREHPLPWRGPRPCLFPTRPACWGTPWTPRFCAGTGWGTAAERRPSPPRALSRFVQIRMFLAKGTTPCSQKGLSPFVSHFGESLEDGVAAEKLATTLN